MMMMPLPIHRMFSAADSFLANLNHAPALPACRNRLAKSTLWRGRGYGDLATVESVALETDGSFSVIGRGS